MTNYSAQIKRSRDFCNQNISLGQILTQSYCIRNIYTSNNYILYRALVSVGAVGAQHPQIPREIHLKAFISDKNRVFFRQNSKSAPTDLES